MSAVHGISSDELADAAGITYRQLDYWTRQGVLEPLGERCPGSGAWRRWATSEVRVAVVVARLTALGARAETLAVVAPLVRAMTEDEWHGELLISSGGLVEHLRAWAPASFGEACYVLNLDLIAHRALAA